MICLLCILMNVKPWLILIKIFPLPTLNNFTCKTISLQNYKNPKDCFYNQKWQENYFLVEYSYFLRNMAGTVEHVWLHSIASEKGETTISRVMDEINTFVTKSLFFFSFSEWDNFWKSNDKIPLVTNWGGKEEEEVWF